MNEDFVWNEGVIARAISTQTLAKKCVVLVDRCNWTGHECDVLAVTNDLRIIDIEIKISRSDLKADAKKDKWWTRTYGPWDPVRRTNDMIQTAKEHPRKVWKHYYAMPSEIWKPDLIDCLPSESSGVILMGLQRNTVTPIIASVVRRAKPNRDASKLTSTQVMDIARLANLRMWEAYKKGEEAAKEASDYYHGRRQTMTAYSPQTA